MISKFCFSTFHTVHIQTVGQKWCGDSERAVNDWSEQEGPSDQRLYSSSFSSLSEEEFPFIPTYHIHTNDGIPIICASLPVRISSYSSNVLSFLSNQLHWEDWRIMQQTCCGQLLRIQEQTKTTTWFRNQQDVMIGITDASLPVNTESVRDGERDEKAVSHQTSSYYPVSIDQRQKSERKSLWLELWSGVHVIHPIRTGNMCRDGLENERKSRNLLCLQSNNTLSLVLLLLLFAVCLYLLLLPTSLVRSSSRFSLYCKSHTT